MKARGKRGARRPWFLQYAQSGLKGRNICSITPLQGWASLIRVPGATRFALAPGFHIPRLWRWVPRLWRCISQVALTLVLKPLQFLPGLVGVVAEEHDVVLAFIEIET